MQVIAILPQGLELEGVREIEAIGGQSVRPLKRAAAFECDMACFYRLHIQAMLPFRFLREMARFECTNPKMLYREVQIALDWKNWLHHSMSFRVDVTGSKEGLNHSHFTALQVKNAIIDLQRKLWGERSSINLNKPDLLIHLHINNQEAILSLDGSNGSLHKRGYKTQMGLAPIKENLAAGLIRLSEWNFHCPFVDPMCGSGTLLIEAAKMALKISPGINRRFAFENWADFNQKIWKQEIDNAQNSSRRKNESPIIIGCEENPSIAAQAEENIAESGLTEIIQIQKSHFREINLPQQNGLIACNPPYGKRIGSQQDLAPLYQELGSFLKDHASGWQLWLLNGNPKLSRFLKMKCDRRIPINNGGIDCRWLHYEIH